MKYHRKQQYIPGTFRTNLPEERKRSLEEKLHFMVLDNNYKACLITQNPHGDKVEALQDWVWPANTKGEVNQELWHEIKRDWIEAHDHRWITGLKNRRVVVQAGGNAGMYPRMLAEYFAWVYTFEPTPLSFYCLTQNCQRDNIVKMQCALGDVAGTVGYVNHENNTGVNTVHTDVVDGMMPQITLDSLNLPMVDLIALDVEHYEEKVLIGAKETIIKFKPRIVMELGDRTELKNFLIPLGYVQKEKSAMDVIWDHP
jgi:FkbM family methyltransferase